MTHAARALQSYGLSREGIKLWITYILFDHTRTWRASSDEESAQCRGHLRDNANIKDDTIHAPIHANKANMKGVYDGQMIFGDHRGRKIPIICLSGQEKSRKKTSPRKPVPTEHGSAAWQARTQLPAPQRWTMYGTVHYPKHELYNLCIGKQTLKNINKGKNQ